MLPDCLRALSTQSLHAGAYEIIVVIDSSQDRSAEVARSFNVRVIERSSRGGVSAARNAGIREARGTWVAFTDHDCIPSRSWLKNLLQAVGNGENPDALGAAGKTLGYESNSQAARFVDLTGGLDAGRHLVHPLYPFAPAGNLMYKRQALERVGGFDERLPSYETCDLHYRVRRACPGEFYYEPRALVLHRHRSSWKEYWRQQVGYGRGGGRFYLKYDEEIRWSMRREIAAWGRIGLMGLGASWPGTKDAWLVRRGRFVKEFAQRVGFVSTYWNPEERRRWSKST